LTLIIAALSFIAILYFGFFPRPAVLPQRDSSIAYIGDIPAIHVLGFGASTDVSGQLRYHLVYKNQPPGVKVGDVLTFRQVMCAVVFLELGKGLSDDTDPTHNVALCRVIGGA
jgi:hypothetical protein